MLLTGEEEKIRGPFWVNMILCAVLGVLALQRPGLLPYFLLLTLLTTALLVYRTFFLPRIRSKRYEKITKASSFYMRRKAIRIYEDRLEVASLEEEAGTFLFSFPFAFLIQVGETTDYFYLFFSTDKWIPIQKKNCTLPQQNQLRSLLGRYCRNYQQLSVSDA